jgi:hypothetical protein
LLHSWLAGGEHVDGQVVAVLTQNRALSSVLSPATAPRHGALERISGQVTMLKGVETHNNKVSVWKN